MSLIVAIDGPGGSGKSTVSRLVAERAGLPHLDTGAFYRAATLAVIRSGGDPDDAAAVLSAVGESTFEQENGRMYLNGIDVSDEIRGDDVTAAVSSVSAHPALRSTLVGIQRHWIERHAGRGVVEGRDIGSVVFPDANVKIYLDATPEVRARRRATEIGEDPSQVLCDLNRRDRFDSTRAASPMTVPEGAIVVDTSHLSLDEVVGKILETIAAKS